MTLFIPGYAGTIWTGVRASLAYAANNLNASTPQQTKALAKVIAATLKNASNAIAAGQMYAGLQQLYGQLAQLPPLALNLDSVSNAMVNSRIAAIQAAALSVKSLLVVPGNVTQLLAANNPAIPDPGFLEWLVGFNFESAPPEVGNGSITSVLVQQAQTEATAWSNVALALQQKGIKFSGPLLNAVLLMQNVSSIVAAETGNSVLSSTVAWTSLWNQFAAMPAITRCVDAITNDPTNPSAQQIAVVRVVILQSLLQFNKLIVSLRDVVTAQLRLGTLRKGDSLLTFANRELGNYAAWRQIAQLNGLEPPYISKVKAPQVAVPGQQLFLPPVNAVTLIAPEIAPVASYVTNYLGVDRYLGPLNSPMLTWTGDYQIISGYQNLALSLGRRLQTTIGLLMYHPRFGSRIPPELGSVASQDVSALLVKYTISALLSDSRVNKVVTCTANLLGNYSVAINAVVLPNGLGQEQVTVNEVIGPP